jgi:DNA polymerase-3 subunit epsilon
LAAEDPARGAARLADQVHRVDWSQTAGELGAALREGECIRTLQPAHNRRIKSKGGAFTLRMVTGPGPGARTGAGTGADGAGGGAMHISLTAIDALERQDLAHCFGVFQSQKDARKAFMDIAAAKQLCLKVLGFEDGVGSCLAYQILKCKGACIGKEPQVLHNMRLQLALSALKLKSWPFPGRIALRELAPRAGFTDQPFAADMHVLDDWAYLGTAHSDAELAALAAQECRSAFDVDVYKILVRYFADNPKLDWHDLRDKTSCA